MAPGKAGEPAAAEEAAWQVHQELALVWRPRFQAKWEFKKSARSIKGWGKKEAVEPLTVGRIIGHISVVNHPPEPSECDGNG